MPVRGRSEEAKQFTIPVIRPHQLEIVRVRAALIRIVEEPDVSRDHAAALAGRLHGEPHREGHGTHEDRQAGFPLHQRIARYPVINTVARIVRLGNDRVERNAIKRRVHFIGDLLEPAAQNGQRNRIRRGILPALNDRACRALCQILMRS